MNSKYLFFANCVPVKGAQRSIICDLQRNAYTLIPNSLVDLLIDNRFLDIDNITQHLTKSDVAILNEYIEYLQELEFIYPINDNEFDHFPELSMQWNFPSIITNMVIDVDNESDHDFEKLISEVDQLRCRHIQLRCFDPISIECRDRIMELINESAIRTVDVLVPFSEGFDAISTWVNENPKIRSITLHAAPEDKVIFKGKKGFGIVLSVKEKIISASHCGIIHPTYFSINVETFTESLHHNTCLNRKVSIDVDGNIKNCPSMKESFGNIKDTTLIEAIEKPGFKKYWNITKDQIAGCKDCEFRHICTDCRAYLEHPQDGYSKPLKCGYDPYTCTWEEWSTNPLKQKAIEYYGI